MEFQSHFIALAGLILVLVLWYYHHRRFKNLTHKSKGNSPPEPTGGWPFIGHLLLLQDKVPVYRTLGAMADKFGSVFMIRLGMYRTVVVSDHEVVKECFTTNDKVLASRPSSAAAKILFHNASLALAPYGSFWREIRKLIVLEVLSAHRLNESTHVQVSELQAGIKDMYMLGNKWLNPEKVVMSEWFDHITFNVMLRIMVGKRAFSNVVHGSEEARSTVVAIKKMIYQLGVFVPSDAIPFLEFLDLQGHLGSMKLVAKEMDSVVDSWIEEHKERLSSEPESRQDFIDIMLTKLKDDALFGHSREAIVKATVVTMIGAGFESTSSTSTWLVALLLNNRHVMKRVQEELDTKVGRDRWVEQLDIENLVYLKAVVKETLRLYGAGPLLLPHEAMEDCCIGGYHIPKGTRLLVNAWKMHRDPIVWSNPEEFQPERFLTSHAGVDVYGQNFELIPFGSGRRVCPGLNMGLQMLHLTIARLLQGFDLATPSNSPMDLTEGISLSMLKATPLEVMVTPRLLAELY